MKDELTPLEVVREVAKEFSDYDELARLAIEVRYGRIVTGDIRKRAAGAIIGLACVLDALLSDGVTHDQA